MVLVVGEGNNFNNQPNDHQMCLHVFRAASSPNCCNYALKKTAVDKIVQFGSEATRTLMSNFYVDMLKSTPDVQSAINLIKAVTKMCKTGGFKLGKFITNNNVVLKAKEGRVLKMLI